MRNLKLNNIRIFRHAFAFNKHAGLKMPVLANTAFGPQFSKSTF